MRELIAPLALLLAVPAFAQVGGTPGAGSGSTATLLYSTAAPSGTCASRTIVWVTTTNVPYVCEAGTWVSMIESAGASFPLLAPNGTAAAPSYSFTNDSNAGMGVINPGVGASVVFGGEGAWRFGVHDSVVTMGSAIRFGWESSATITGAAPDTGLARNSAGVVGVTNGGSGSGALDVGNAGYMRLSGASGVSAAISQPSGGANNGIYIQPGGTNLASGFFNRSGAPAIEGFYAALATNTATLNLGTSGSYWTYTNTGDADGSTINLPNDPISGYTVTVLATVAQDITLAPAAGETIMFGNTVCATSFVIGGAATGIGDSVTVVASSTGNGAVWITTASAGTPVCTP